MTFSSYNSCLSFAIELGPSLRVERADGWGVDVKVLDAAGVVLEVLGEELLGPLGNLGVGSGGRQAVYFKLGFVDFSQHVAICIGFAL